MALRETIHDTDIDLFRQELVNLMDLRHELCTLAGKIDWQALPCLDARLRRQRAVPKAKGLVAGLHDVTVVRQPVQQCRGYLGVAKHR